MKLQVYLEPELAARSSSFCQRSGKPRNALVQEALRAFMASEEKPVLV